MASRLPRFVSAQPDTPWFVWQCRIYLHNLLDLGVPGDRLTALFALEAGTDPTPELDALRARFPSVDVAIFTDLRDERARRYAPSVQPHLIERWLRDDASRVDEPTFFHDSDIAFRRLPDFAGMLDAHPGACLLSDTDDYLGYDYLHGVAERIGEERPALPVDDLLHRMAEVVGIDAEMVRQHRGRSGGAQYLLTGVGPDVWAKIHDDSVALWELFGAYVREHELRHEPADYLQVWTAGMWAYLWNLWAADHETVIHPELAFLFGAADLDDDSPILHIAGKTEPGQVGRFDKVDWHGLDPVEAVTHQPYLFDHHDPGSVAEAYGELIRAAAGVAAPTRTDPTPSTEWRLLTWRTGPDPMWDVEHVHVGFDDPDVTIVGHDSSGDAGPGFEVGHAFDETARIWGGRAEYRPECRPELFVSVQLDRPAVPSTVTITHAPSGHRANLVLLQQRDGDGWRTVTVEPLADQDGTQVVRHVGAAVDVAVAWRIVTDTTSSAFAWDVHRFDLFATGERSSAPIEGSGDAGPDFGVERLATGGTWGGRADADGHFHLTAADPDGVRLDHIVLVQGDTHHADHVVLQRFEDGDWVDVRRFDDLHPGRNDLFLGRPPAHWRGPRRATRTAPQRPPLRFGPFDDRRILVTIAAYRDPDVANTVANALAQAAYPEHVRFAICHQYDDATRDVLAPWRDDPRFQIDAVPHRESQGCCWARHRTFEAYDDEPYLLQIDAHTRFAARWDVRYVEMLESIDVERPLLTSYPPRFTIDADGAVSYDLASGVQSLRIAEVRADLTTLQKTDRVDDLTAPTSSPTVAAGQIFTHGRFCRDVPYDPKLYFAGEEISIAARAFTHGYDLFAPNENLIWHRYDHDEPKHWEDDDQHGDHHRRATERLRVLFQADHRVLGRYGLGGARTLGAFERHAGIDLRGRAVDGPLTIEIPPSAVSPRDDFETFVIVLLDANGAELARRDVRDPAVLEGLTTTITVRDLGPDQARAERYVIVPTRRNGAIGEVVLRPIRTGR